MAWFDLRPGGAVEGYNACSLHPRITRMECASIVPPSIAPPGRRDTWTARAITRALAEPGARLRPESEAAISR